MTTTEDVQTEAKRLADEAARKAKEDADASTEEQEPTAEELKAKLADSQKRIKELNHESADRRKKLEAFETAEAERKTAEMSEIDKANAKAKTVEEEREKLAKENRMLTLQRDFENKVRDAKLEFKNSLASKDAFNALVELLGDEKEITDEHIKTLVKERDYLFGKTEPVTYSNDAGAKGKANQTILTKELIAAKKQMISPL